MARAAGSGAWAQGPSGLLPQMLAHSGHPDLGWPDLLSLQRMSLAGGAVGASLGSPVPAAAPQQGPSGGGPVDIGPTGLVLAAALMAVNSALSVWLRLGLQQKLVVASIRCFVQLSVLGYILVPIFTVNAWWLTALYTAFMLGVAAIEAVSRPTQLYSGMLPQVLLAMGLGSAGVIAYGLAIVVGVQPWYHPQYLIPMLGMLLGNACSGIAIGLSTVLDELSSSRDQVELLLALGATRWEATAELVQRGVRLALLPTLNSMSVVGIVSIPGMMTGQILGGSDPAVAARYQIVIYYLVGTSSGLSCVATVFMAVWSIVDGESRLRSERLRPRSASGRGALSWLAAQARQGWDGACTGARLAAARVRRAFSIASNHRHRFFAFRRGVSLARTSGGTHPLSPQPGGSPERVQVRVVPPEGTDEGLRAPLLAGARGGDAPAGGGR